MKPLKGYWQRLIAALEQFYSPKELRALGLFLLAGIAALLYRLFDSPAGQALGPRDPAHVREAQARDSMFQLLARRRAEADSFYFYYPDTSKLTQKPVRERSPGDEPKPRTSVSLNASSRDQLLQLPSIGPATADLILEYRAKRGKFRTLTEIMNVRGIGSKKFERIKPYLRLD